MSNKAFIALAASVAALSLGNAAQAQSNNSDSLRQILGAVLGQVTSMDAQWQRGQRPLTAGRVQFSARLDADVRARTLSTVAADRLRADYDALVALETQYGDDGVFTPQERTELRNRYDALTQTYSEGGPAVAGGVSAAQGQAAFYARIDAALAARRITRAQATALRTDYAAVVQLENTYARGGLSAAEQSALDNRLDALDARIPEPATPPAPVQLSIRDQLDQLSRNLPAAQRSGIVTASQAAELRVQIADLQRLDAAYARNRPAQDDSAYLERRVREIETRTTRRVGR